MKVDKYIGNQFFETVFFGSKELSENEKMRLEEERQKDLLEYRRMCPDKCYMDINYKVTN